MFINISISGIPADCHAEQNGKKEFAVQLYWPDEESGPEESTADWFDVVPTDAIKLDDCGER